MLLSRINHAEGLVISAAVRHRNLLYIVLTYRQGNKMAKLKWRAFEVRSEFKSQSLYWKYVCFEWLCHFFESSFQHQIFVMMKRNIHVSSSLSVFVWTVLVPFHFLREKEIQWYRNLKDGMIPLGQHKGHRVEAGPWRSKSMSSAWKGKLCLAVGNHLNEGLKTRSHNTCVEYMGC